MDYVAALRMRRVRPAYRKIARAIESCRTPEQLDSARNMIDTFRRSFPYAGNFTDELNTKLYSHPMFYEMYNNK